jgi:hypothetical protein
MRIGGIYAEIRARTTKLKYDLGGAKSMVQKSANDMQRELNGIGFTALGLAATAFGAAVTMALRRSIDAASDLEEATSKFNVVFKDQVGLAEDWSRELVSGYAMSTREAKQYLASVQDLLVPMGMQSKAAAQMSSEVVKLAADLGSFNNLPTAQVIADMQSALVGNYETMKKYGVVLNEAVVSQQAFAKGLAETKKDLTAADKAQSAYELIVKSSTAAIGDMDRTADGYANTTKRLNAAWEDLTATMGGKFLKVAAKIKGITADILENLTKAAQGPSIDQQILDVEARISELLLTQEQKRYELAQKRIEREERHQKEVERFLKQTAGPAGSESAQVLADFQARRAEQLQKDPVVFELEQLRQRLDELKALRDSVAEIPVTGGQAGGGIAAAAAPDLVELADTGPLGVDLERMGAELDEYREIMDEKYRIQLNNAAKEQKVWLMNLEARKRAADEEIEHRQNAQRTAVSNTKNFLAIMGRQSQAAFEAYKIWQTGEAIIAGHKAATDAWAWGMKTGGPPLAAAFAAASIAYTAAKISAIQSASFGGGSGSSGGAVGTYSVNPTTEVPVFEPEEQRSTLTVNIYGDVSDPESFVDALVDKINDAVDRDVLINYARETRAA